MLVLWKFHVSHSLSLSVCFVIGLKQRATIYVSVLIFRTFKQIITVCVWYAFYYHFSFFRRLRQHQKTHNLFHVVWTVRWLTYTYLPLIAKFTWHYCTAFLKMPYYSNKIGWPLVNRSRSWVITLSMNIIVQALIWEN